MPSGSPFRRGPFAFRPAVSAPSKSNYQFTLTNTVVNAAGTPVSGVTAYLHDSATGARMAQTTTDANGVFTFYPNNGATYFVVLYKAGTPDLFATTPNNLVSS